MSAVLSPEIEAALYRLQVAVKNKGATLERVRIATTEHASPDVIYTSELGTILVELVP